MAAPQVRAGWASPPLSRWPNNRRNHLLYNLLTRSNALRWNAVLDAPASAFVNCRRRRRASKTAFPLRTVGTSNWPGGGKDLERGEWASPTEVVA